MRALPTDPHSSHVSPVAKLAAAVAMLVALFGLLVAAAYPGVAAAFVLGALSAVALRRATRRLADSRGLCVPGTDICLRRSEDV
jgi:Flp pilus assembly protein TadB